MKTIFARHLARISAALAVFAAVAAVPVQAQTNVTTGGGEVRGFLARSAIIYAATYGGGLIQSTTTGSTWSRVTLNGLSGNPRYFTSIAGGTSGYFVIGGEEGLFLTTDGTNFTQVLSEPVSAVAVGSGANANYVLAGVKGVGIMRSTDSGASFSVADNSSLNSLDIVAIAADPVTTARFFLAARPEGNGAGGTGTRGGVFESLNAGQSWTMDPNFFANTGSRFVASLAVDSAGIVYAGVLRPTDNGGDAYYRSGATWLATGALFGGVVSLHRDANTPGVMWAGTRALGLLTGSTTTFNYAYNNSNTPHIFGTGVNATATIPGNTNVVLKALRGAGVWRSAVVASPRTWSRVTLPGVDRVLSASGVSSGGSVILAGLFAGGVWRSSDGGGTFMPPTTSPPSGTVPAGFTMNGAMDIASTDPFMSIWQLSASSATDNNIYAAAGGNGMFYANNGNGVFRWNGTCWQAVGISAPSSAVCAGASEAGLPFGGTQVFGVTVNPANDVIANASFMGATFGTYVRSGGASWSLANLGPVLTAQMRGVVAAAGGARVIGLPFDDKPILSTNSGSTYGQTSVSQMGFERLRFFSVAQNPGTPSQWIAGSNKGIFRSVDDGATWTRVSGTPLQKLAVTAVGFKPSDGRAFAADFDGNRYCSTTGGTSWVALGALRAGVNAIKVIGTNLYYLTDGGGLFLETGSC